MERRARYSTGTSAVGHRQSCASDTKVAKDIALTGQAVLVATQTFRQFATPITYTNVTMKSMEQLCAKLEARLTQPLIALYSQGYNIGGGVTEGMVMLNRLRRA